MGNDVAVPQVTLVMLDALLDTRLGTVCRMDADMAVRLMQNPAYYTRANDDLSLLEPTLDVNRFKELYRTRNVETLSESMITPMMFELASIVFHLEEQRLNTPFAERVEVVVNLYPYELDAESQEELAAAVSAYLPYDTTVTLRSIHVRDLTPAVIKRDYSGVLLYDLAEWFQIHGEALGEVKIPAVTVLAPKLHTGSQSAFEAGALGEGLEHIDPYEAIQRFTSFLMGLEFVDMRLYSIISPEEASLRLEETLRRRMARSDGTQPDSIPA